MATQSIKFSNANADFFSTLNKRVNEYFRTEGIDRHGNTAMIIKTIFMFSLYTIPYALIITGVVSNIWLLLGLCLVMGIGIGGIGLSVMHDANHGAYSNKKWVNNLLGYSLNLVGGNAFNWKVQHNVLHHTYTNIHDVDEDISPRGILRMSPHGDWKPFHKFQYIYAWFFYGLLTFVWVVQKDFNRILKYKKEGLIDKQKSTFAKELTILLATKAVYVGYMVVLPVMLLPIAWWQVLVGILIMHYVAGFILAIVFQPAHVIDGTEYPLPDEDGNLENNWAIHQLITTTNYANKNKWLSWYVGGLNFQVEHHLFPHICHVHYQKLSKIVEQTAGEFGLPYKSHPTFRSALLGHLKLLKQLGERPKIYTPAAKLAA
jgi:linoleoyl-CoA desaturase